MNININCDKLNCDNLNYMINVLDNLIKYYNEDVECEENVKEFSEIKNKLEKYIEKRERE